MNKTSAILQSSTSVMGRRNANSPTNAKPFSLAANNMKTLNFIIAFVFISLTSFGQTSDSLPINSSFKFSQDVSFISFGVFCGMCRSDKVISYYYDVSSAEKSLLLDETEKYFMTKDKKYFSTKIIDSTKIKLAESIIKNIPKRFFITDKLEQKFGCPDCFDQGGIFVRIGQSNKTQTFYIDAAFEKLDLDIKTFVIFFNKTFKELRKIK